jgi:hypothetical protein
MKPFAFAGAVALVCVSLAACNSQIAQSLTGGAAANSGLVAVAAKLDAGLAVARSDVPALCTLAANAALIGEAAALATSAASIAKAANVASVAASRSVCTQGLTGAVTDAVTLATSIMAVSRAAKTPATAIATAP